MQIKHSCRFLVILSMCFLMVACTSPTPMAPQASLSPSSEPRPTTLPTEESMQTLEETIEPAPEEVENEDRELVYLYAIKGAIEGANLVNVATGAPEDDEGCGTPGFNANNEETGELILVLNYAPSLIPHQMNLFLEGDPTDIERVEILNSTNGLGQQIYPGGTPAIEEEIIDDYCSTFLSFPLNVDFEVDTVFISFSAPAAAGRVDAVELVAYADELEGASSRFYEAPVYWRLPIPEQPVSVVVDQYNQVFVASENRNIYTYDIEGNFLGEIQSVTKGTLTDITIDNHNHLVLSDGTNGTYTILTKDEDDMTGGGEAPANQVAVQPDNGKLFLLGDLGGLFYLIPYFPGTDEIINPLPLDDIAYSGLAFSPENRLYTIRPNDAFLAEIDPVSGLEVYSIPLKTAEYMDPLPVDLSIDAEGNFYVLFTRNEGNTAIAVLDPNGALIRRAGALVEPVNGEWPQGSYNDPRSIAITADGRFALVVDGEDGNYYLTCLLMRED